MCCQKWIYVTGSYTVPVLIFDQSCTSGYTVCKGNQCENDLSNENKTNMIYWCEIHTTTII